MKIIHDKTKNKNLSRDIRDNSLWYQYLRNCYTFILAMFQRSSKTLFIFGILGFSLLALLPTNVLATEYYDPTTGGDIQTVSNSQYTGEIFILSTYVTLTTTSISWYNVAPPIKNYYADLVILNETGTILTSSTNIFVGNDYGKTGEEYQVDIPNISLAPGAYFIGVKMATSSDTGIRKGSPNDFYPTMGRKNLSPGTNWECNRTYGSQGEIIDCSNQWDSTDDLGFHITGTARYTTSSEVIWSYQIPTSSMATSGIWATCQTESYMTWYDPSSWFTSSTIRMIGCVTFVPTGGLTFLKEQFNEWTTTFPVSMFFHFDGIIRQEFGNYINNSESKLTFPIVMPNGASSTIYLLTSSSLSSIVGSNTMTTWFTFQKYLFYIIIGWIIIGIITKKKPLS